MKQHSHNKNTHSVGHVHFDLAVLADVQGDVNGGVVGAALLHGDVAARRYVVCHVYGIAVRTENRYAFAPLGDFSEL